jgi:hypothetical protein|tara:strand:+ start:743 stop:946 length:204 start_codon:yes stop_codon:yes gene_type:complete
MIIRDVHIIKAQEELDELIKFRNTFMMRKYDEKYPEKKGTDLLVRTINLKKKALCKLYIDKMKIYLE